MAFAPERGPTGAIAGGKARKTDLRRGDPVPGRRFPLTAAEGGADHSRARHLEANRLLIEEVRQEARSVCRGGRKSRRR